MKKALSVITQSDLKFWIPIIGIIVSGAITINSLAKDVEALEKAKEVLMPEYRQTMKEINEKLDRIPIMETNQGHIMRELGIEIK